MKIFKIAFSIFLMCITLSGCSMIFSKAPYEPPEISTDIDANATIEIGEQKLKCTVTFGEKSMASVTITQPEALSGLTYKWVDSKLTIDYNTLSLQTDNGFVTKENFAQTLYDLLSAINTEPPPELQSYDENTVRFLGHTLDGDFHVTTDRTGAIVSIEKLKYKVTFEI